MRTETRTVKVICDECGADMTNQDINPDEATVTWNGKDFKVVHAKLITPVFIPNDSTATYDLCKTCRSTIYTIFQSL